MRQAIACATELAVVLFSLQTVFLLCWNLLIVFQKVTNESPEQIFSVENDILKDDFTLLLSTVLFLSEAIVGLATAHQLSRWNKNNLRIKYKKPQKKVPVPYQAQPLSYPTVTVPEEARPLLLFADVQPPCIPPPDFVVAVPTIQAMPLEPIAEEVPKKGIRISEITWMVIWLSAIVITATAVKVIPITLGASAIFAFIVNLLIGETDLGQRKKKNNKKTSKTMELLESGQLREKHTWKCDPVTECVLWMQALLSFCKFMHHSVLVGILFLAVPMDNL
eukprot:CAMPEP_0168575260 /NCGR_PEP_ID=MMETSP0413-20121227/19562_1 /TAXON_ID=136452 /ORGANISM="Filamoeba nolandi, Strain NC-AS-23-1" /LENGTH=277 /DNA_ID=CAMNT_0008608743 /DNA_START=55 /DNA_END=885 /DNA_ORIENTATION=+